MTRSRLLDPLDLGLSSFVERATGDGNATKNEEPIYEKVPLRPLLSATIKMQLK